ncbi:MAG: hypothetical protein IPM82_03205 [Saprospiraceae bacterium]|nr:hypothetical protein [Saprospiraceae bacterium]
MLPAGTLTIKTLTVQSGGVLTIASAGTLTIDDSPYPGIVNQGTLTNSGIINIGQNAFVGTFGIENAGVFNNNMGGQIKIDRSWNVPLFNNGGTFTNAATITIGSLATAGDWCIHNTGTFHNNAGGVIHANKSIQFGIKEQQHGWANQY